MRHLEAAKAVALASEGTGKRNSFRVGAVLFKGKTIYAAKHNSYKTHPILARYTRFPHLHAESHCILSHGIDRCHALDLLCVRVNIHNAFSMAKPCKTCTRLMADVGIRRVYYTDWDGEVQML